jgi:cyanate lyase
MSQESVTPPGLLDQQRSALEMLNAARVGRGMSIAALAAVIGAPKVWTAAMLAGQHPLTPAHLDPLAEELELSVEDLRPLLAVPMRTGIGATVPVDPTIYRLYEVVQVYGEAIKAVIHEEFGDGIMSAINFGMDIRRIPDPAGDRVEITMSGKFLPYEWKGV